MRTARPIRLAACAFAAAALAIGSGACSDGSPSVRGTPAAAEVALGTNDVPDDLALCDYSGPVPQYLANVRETARDNHEVMTRVWTSLIDAGAVEGHITVHAESPEVCKYWITGAPGGHERDVMRVVSSLVVRFPDAAAAEAAFAKNLFEQDKIAGAEGFRVQQGDATGLGPNSTFAVEGTTVTGAAQAVWQAGPFNLFVTTRHLTEPEVKAAVDNAKTRTIGEN